MADDDQQKEAQTAAEQAEEAKDEAEVAAEVAEEAAETAEEAAEVAEEAAEKAEEKAEEAAKSEAKTEDKPAKEYSADITKIIEQIEKMTVLEVADLVSAIEDKFGVSAAPVAVAGAVAGGAAAGGDEGGAEEKSSYTIHLAAAGDQKINVIKAVREITQLGLKEAKDLVDGAPKDVKENVPKEDAEEAKQKLEAAGATVELK
jgi:large subunit ribosomal protein L7/L12